MPEELTNATESADGVSLAPAAPVPGGLTMWNDVKLMQNAWKTASMISKSALVPDSYRNSPENCLVAIAP